MNINIRKIGALLLLLFSIFTLVACQNITEEVTVESIQVEISTLNPNYNVDDFDLSTISIRVTFSDGKFQIIPITESMLTEEHLSLLSNVGEHQITITYQGKSTTINLNLQYDSLKTQLMTLYTLSTTSGSFSGTYEEWLETVRGPQGNPGREVLFQVAEGYIQWQYTGDTTWTNLVELASLVGPAGQDGVDGKQVTFQVSEGFIQWQYVGDTTWTNLIEIATITGNNGTDGVDGLTPFIGDNGNWWIGENDTGVYAGNQATIPQTGEFQYAVNSDGQSYVFIKYVGNDRYVRIPDYYNGYPVVAIAKDAFNNNTILETVILPNKLKIIEKYSFYGASSLTSIVIPNSVTSIGSYAFYGASSLTSIVIPNSITSIGSYAFQNSGLQTITFEEGAQLNSIGESAFYGTSRLTAIEIPNSVTSIGSYAFYGASSLTSIVIPNSVTSIGDSAFRGASSLTSIVIPNSVTSIGDSAFRGASSLKSIEIPNSVTSIGESAFFEASSLTSIVIPNSVTSIGDSAFRGASNLTSIVIPNSVTSIGEGAFQGANNLTSITLPFVGGSRSTSTTVQSSYSVSQYLFGYIFGSTTLTTTANATNLVYQGQGLSNNNYRHYYIPSSLTSITITDASGISANAFYGMTNVTSITLNEGITFIGNNAFYGMTGLLSMEVPSSVTSIGTHTWYNNTSLESITLPDVTMIPAYAFYGTSSLTIIDIPVTVSQINEYAFYNSGLTSLTLPEITTSIGAYAFYGLSGVTTLVISENVQSIGSYAFSGANNVTSLTFDSNVLSTIGNFAFQNIKVTTLIIPNSVTSIGEGAFQGANNLTSITLPFVGGSRSTSTTVQSSYSVSQYLFGYIFGSTTLTTIANATNLVYQGQGLSNNKYRHYYIPSSLTSITITDASGISANAFYGMTNVTSITLNEGITFIGNNAFYGIEHLAP